MADTADTADTMANTANILARYRREADATSAEAGRNSPAANRENTATGAVETGEAVIGAAIGGVAVTGAAAADRLYRRRLSVLLEWVPILGLALSLLVLQLLSFVFVRLRQLLRIKTAILSALTHRRPRQDGGSVV